MIIDQQTAASWIMAPAIEAMDGLKEDSIAMKENLLKGDFVRWRESWTPGRRRKGRLQGFPLTGSTTSTALRPPTARLPERSLAPAAAVL